MKKKIQSSLFIFLFSYVLCVGEAGAIFLLINPGAGPAGSGEAQTGKANDAYATFYNPAGLGFIKENQVALQHVNWLPNLVDDVFYDFLAFTYHKEDLGTFGGHIIYLNLGEQTGMDEDGNPTGIFQSYLSAITASYGMQLNETSSIGMSFKVFHQKLADYATAYESGKPYSTDFGFDVGYLKKFGTKNQHQFGFAIQNIGPPIDFLDAEQADPAPTNMRLGVYAELFKDDINTVHFLFDASKILVASYVPMDWNEDGIIGNGGPKEDNLENYMLDEYYHTDEWYKGVATAWLDDWYYGGDYDLCNEDCTNGNNNNGYNDGVDYRIGGYSPMQFEIANSPTQIFVPNYSGFCDDGDNNAVCYDVIDIEGNTNPDGRIDFIDLPNDSLAMNDNDDNGQSYDQDYYDIKIDYIEDPENQGTYIPVLDYEYEFTDSEYGIYNAFGNSEKGTGDERSFKTELQEMIYNIGFEYWYTDNVAFRTGFIYDEEGNVKNPTLGIGIKFNRYGFDFGYTSGKETDSRANTMFFSLAIGF